MSVILTLYWIMMFLFFTKEKSYKAACLMFVMAVVMFVYTLFLVGAF